MNGQPMRVLIVEDDVDHAELIRRTLDRQTPPVSVTTVGNGPACLAALRDGDYAVVLLDYSLPGMDGLQVLEKIRQEGWTLPVVIVTGQGDERVAVRAMRSGGADYVVKTTGYVAALPTTLYKVLQQHELAAENARLFREAERALADLKATQALLVRAETLRALGELASGLAHHMNNVLAVVIGRAEFGLARPAAEPLRPLLETIARAAREGADVVRRVQEFSRMRQLLEPVPVDVNQLAREVVEMTRVRWRNAAQVRGILVDVSLDLATLPPVSGQPGALREVVMSLLLNAIEALSSGGRITVRTRTDDDSVVLAVEDDGVGMSPETLSRAMEPFFTTKGVDNAGLGLSVSYSIVQRHGGELRLESGEGRGTTATIRLPAGADANVPGAAETREPSPRGALDILVVDDEEDVLEMLVDLVRMQGHRVRQATSGRDALRQLERDGPPDVVLTDLGMPGMTGWELAAAVKRRWPGVTVGAVTGWGTDLDEPPEHRAVVEFVLAKPVSEVELEKRLAGVR